MPTTRLPSAHAPGSLAARLVALAVLCFALLVPSTALATGSPDITLSATTDPTVLYGTQSTVTLTAASPVGAPAGYNLSYRAVLPAGVSYAAGSAGANAGEPSIITGQPLTGQTTLIWKNVADLATASSHALTFKVSASTTSITIGATYTINGGAYLSNDRRWVPAFTATGQPDATVAHPYTGFSDNKTASTKVIGIEIDEDTSAAPGGKLLRGVHDNQVTYTLTVKGNSVASVTGVSVDEYLPPGLEFLGCGGAGSDRTTDAPTNPGSPNEYPGSGPISVATLSGCTAPTQVNIGTFDPTGPAPNALYTHVRWSLGAIPNGLSATIKYRAAVPLRANTATWSGATPAATGAQTANLDNNSGAETVNGTPLVNYTNVSGSYNSLFPVASDTSLTRTASDLRLVKTAQTTGLAQGATTLWDLKLTTSEYRDASAITVTDTLPDGLCPLKNGATLTHGAPSPQDTAECSSSGPTPTSDSGPAPYKTADEQSDGTWILTWDPSTDAALAQLAPNTSHTITFPTRTRNSYQDAYEDTTPIAASDVITNAASVGATARLACTGGAACPPGAATGAEIGNALTFATAVSDTSSATLTAPSPSIDEKIATTSSDCTLAAYTDGSPAPVYRPGDRICWLLHVDYPAGVDTAQSSVTSFLPTSLGFDSAFGTSGDQLTGNDTVGAPASFDTTTATPGPGGNLVWTLPSASVHGANVFEHRVATRVQLPAGAAPGDVNRNVFKTSSATNSGAAAPLRDDAPYELSMPVMTAQERIVAIDNVAQTASASATVNGGTLVTYRLRLTNANADTPAESVEAWDKLPAGVTCADVTASGNAISDSGVCNSGVVTWGASPAIGPTVTSSAPKDLTYTVRVPTTLQPGQSLTTSSGIRQFQTTTNTGSSFVYIPSSNVDPTQESSANVGPAASSSTVTGALPTITETRDTLLNEGSGPGDFNSNGTATIGETIRYTIVAKIPAGETIQNVVVTDAIDARHLYTAGTLAMVQTGGGPTVAQPTINSGTISMPLGASYAAAAGADTVLTVTFDTTVADLGTNFRQGTNLGNAASLAYTTPAGPTSTLGTGTVATTIVEPSVITDKSTDVGAAPVIGGQTINYTVAVRVGTGSTSAAHETTLVDQVPTTLTPLNAAGNPASNGDATLGGGVWDSTARTVTFTPPSTLYPGEIDSHTYRVTVNTPAQAGTTISAPVSATTTSLPGTVTGERTATSTLHTGYADTHSAPITVATPSVVKSPIAKNLTPGEQVQYTVTVSIPANTILFDGYVKDTVPDIMAFDSYITNTCTAGCGAGTTPFVQQYNVVSGTANTQVVAWDFGDVTTSATSTRTLTLTYFAHLLANRRGTGSTIVRPMASTGPATVASDRTNKVAFNALALPTPAGGFDDTSAPSTSTVTVVEPILTIDKQVAVNGGAYASTMPLVHDGDVLHYRLVVGNTGDNPAYDVSVRDIPNAGIRSVVPAAGTSTTTNFDPWHAPGDDIGWQIPAAIPAGGSVAIDYTADLPPIATLHQNDILSNVATITGSFGLNGTYRSAHGFVYRNYSVTTIPSLTDTQSIKYDAPHITIDKTTGSGSGPTYPDFAGAEVGHSFTWRVTVNNTSATAPATNLFIKDTLPRDWVYEPGATFSSGGPAEPALTPHATGDDLTWSTSIPIAAGASTTLTYAAHPTRASVTSIGTGTAPANRHINSAIAAVQDAAGAFGDGDALFVPPGGADTAYATLSLPSLNIAKTPDAGTAKAGATVPWHIVITNTGSVSASNILIADTFPAGTTYTAGAASASPSAGFSEQAITATDGTWRIATLAGGASVDITVPLRTDPAAASGTLVTNHATVTSDETGPSGSDDGTVTLTPSADVAASKSAPIAATAGQSLQYAIGATNNGPSIAKDIVLTDVLPASVTYVGSSAGCTHTGGSPDTVTCTFTGTTGVGAAVSATIDTAVKANVTTNANNTVHAAAAAASPDPTPGNNDASVSVAVGAQADLSIVKTVQGASPDPHAARAANGTTSTFKLAVANAGPSDASGVMVADTLPAGLTFVPGAGNSAGCAAVGQVVSCPVGSLLAGASQNLTVVARAGHVGAQVNSATVSSATTVEPNLANNTDTATVTVDPAADLTLSKTAPATVGAGDTLTYTLTATNHGPDDATGVQIADTLPAGVVFDTADAGCAAAGQAVTCAVGAVANGASAVRHVTVRVPVALGGQAITNNATVGATEADPDPANAASASTQVGPAADVSITQTGPSSVTAGGTLTYTLSIHNDGPSDAPDVDVTDTLPANLTLNSTSRALGDSARDRRAGAQGRAGGSCGDAAAGVVTCHLGTVATGTSTLVTVTVNTEKGNGGAHVVNDASVSTSVPELSGANNASSLAVLISPAPPEPDPPVVPVETPAPAPAPPGSANLSVSKVAEGVARANRELSYVITATNHGPAAADDVVVDDGLVGGVEYKAYRTADGRCTYERGTIHCKLGSLKVGEVAAVHVTVVPSKTGMLVNDATLASSTSDPDMSDNRAVARNTVSPLPPTTLSITHKTKSKKIRGGARVSYTVKVTNTGKNPASNVQACDRLPAQMSFTSTKGGVLNGSRLCFTTPLLQPGKSITYRVRVRVSARAKRGALINRSFADAENAALQNASARVRVMTDGKVTSEAVHGFTG